MSSNTKQDELLEAISDPGTLNLLYDLWRIVKQTPSRAAEILMQFRDVNGAAQGMVAELTTTMDRFEALRKRLPDLREAVEMLRSANKEMIGSDDKALNRLNRLIDAAEKVRELKATGALDLLKMLK